MSKKMLVNAAQAGEVRVAIIENGILEELNVAFEGAEQIKGNIYKARVVTVESGLQAAFVDYGADRNGFITFNDIHERFYSRPFTGKSGKPRIQDVITVGTELMVQAYKEEVGNKGAALTTDITLPGRYLVIMPLSGSGGVSRKIQDEETRQRLKELIDKLEPPPDMGIIVRTAGEERAKKELQSDFQELVRVWGHIQAKYALARQTGLVYREPNVVIRSVRDYYTDDVEEVVVDDTELHRQVVEFFDRHITEDTGKVKLYTGKMPIFSNFGLERQLENIASHRVPLESGGSIVINPTEALTAIDVNSGKSRGQANQEQMAFETNKEAAEEVARQLRLRDHGGLVVVDFIDMQDSKHRREVEKVLKKAMKRDKARVEMGHISQFGLLELSRQRVKARLLASTHRVCPLCEGSGYVMSTETTAMSMLRRLQELAVSSARGSAIRGRLPVPVALHLLNYHRSSLADLEERFEVTIEITPETGALSTREAFEVGAPAGEKRDVREERRGDRRDARDTRKDSRREKPAAAQSRRRPTSVESADTVEFVADDDEPFQPPRITGFIPADQLAAADLGPDMAPVVEVVEAVEIEEESGDDTATVTAPASEGDDRRRRRRRRRRGRGGDEARATGSSEEGDDDREEEEVAPVAPAVAAVAPPPREEPDRRAAARERNRARREGDGRTEAKVEAPKAAPERSAPQAETSENTEESRRSRRSRNRPSRRDRRLELEATGRVAEVAEVAVVEPTPVVAAPVEERPVGRRTADRLRNRFRGGEVEAVVAEPAVVEPAVVEPAVVEPAVVEPTPVVAAPVEERPVGRRTADRLRNRLRGGEVEAVVAEPAVPAVVEPAPVVAAPVEERPVGRRTADRLRNRLRGGEVEAVVAEPAVVEPTPVVAAPVPAAPADDRPVGRRTADRLRNRLRGGEAEAVVAEPAVVEPAVVEPAVVEPAVVEPAPVPAAPADDRPVGRRTADRLRNRLRGGEAEAVVAEPAVVEPTPVVAAPVPAAPADDRPVGRRTADRLRNRLRGGEVEPVAAAPAVVEPAVVEPAVVEPTPVVAAPADDRPVGRRTADRLRNRLRGGEAEPVAAAPAVVEPAVVEPAVVEPTPVVAAPADDRPAGRRTADRLRNRLRGGEAEVVTVAPAVVEPEPVLAAPTPADERPVAPSGRRGERGRRGEAPTPVVEAASPVEAEGEGRGRRRNRRSGRGDEAPVVAAPVVAAPVVVAPAESGPRRTRRSPAAAPEAPAPVAPTPVAPAVEAAPAAPRRTRKAAPAAATPAPVVPAPVVPAPVVPEAAPKAERPRRTRRGAETPEATARDAAASIFATLGDD